MVRTNSLSYVIFYANSSCIGSVPANLSQPSATSTVLLKQLGWLKCSVADLVNDLSHLYVL